MATMAALKAEAESLLHWFDATKDENDLARLHAVALDRLRAIVAALPQDWSQVPWTDFEPCDIPESKLNSLDPPVGILRNSRYQVTVYLREPGPEDTFGRIAHLSIKVHDKQAHHDWRDLQRIKNELCGEHCDAVEIYPAEDKLVDSANQYHLFVFESYRLPFGFHERLVGDGNWQGSVQRPFPPGERPADCLTPEQFQAKVDAFTKTGGTNGLG